jgi:catechol 2,3-dioxygenase-like lactoylglutathione lyase family enzyme
MAFRVSALDHVQLAMPPGAEAAAEAFYAGILGFEVKPKPEPLAARGGRWFVQGEVQVHLGIEADFRPAGKAHPALRVAGFDDLIAALDAAGWAWRPDHELPGVRRIYVADPFGNRIELIDDDSPAQPTLNGG